MTFVNLYRLIDAMMLFGGTLSLRREGTQQVSACMSRTRNHYRSLAWLVIFMERHGVRMHLKSGAESVESKVAYESRASQFFFDAFRRWYPSGVAPRPAVTPADLIVCPDTLAVWSASGLIRSAPGSDAPVKLTAPRLSPGVARGLSLQVHKLGWRNRVVSAGPYCSLLISAAKRPALERWVEERVPRGVWGLGAETDADTEGEFATMEAVNAGSV